MSPVLMPFFACQLVAEDHLVHARRLVRQVVVRLQLLADVIGVEHGVFGGLPQAVGTVGHDVGQRAHQHAEVAVEHAHPADGLRAVVFKAAAAPFGRSIDHRHRQKRLQDLLAGHRSRARTAAAVGRGERLVQVQVHDVHAEVARPRLAHQGVHVGAVHVEQPALGVHELGNVGRSAGRRRRGCWGW